MKIRDQVFARTFFARRSRRKVLTSMKDTKKGDFTTGPITKNILLFALPLMCGNLLQQMYNIPTHGWQVAFWERMRWQQSDLLIH